jgi:putative spermidine/putrescine transport system permease protein
VARQLTAIASRGLKRPRLATAPGYGLLVLPALALIGALVVWPLVEIIDESLADGGVAYGDVLGSSSFRSTLRATIELSAIVTGLALLLGYPVAYQLTRTKPSTARLVLLGVLLCFWISILVRTYAWTVLLGRNGLINDALTGLGLRDEPADLLFTRFAVIVGMTHYLLPFMILALYAGMRGIDDSLVQAARTLGASGAQAFLKVFLPLSKPAIFAGSTIVFVLGTGFFVTPALLGGPKDATLAVYIERQLYYLEFGNAAAAGMVLLVLVGAAFLVADRVIGLDRLFSSVRTGA